MRAQRSRRGFRSPERVASAALIALLCAVVACEGQDPADTQNYEPGGAGSDRPSLTPPAPASSFATPGESYGPATSSPGTAGNPGTAAPGGQPSTRSPATTPGQTGTSGEEIGSVDTLFHWLGPDDKIVIVAIDDPKVEGVTCHLSRAKTGGMSGAVGLAEDTADASIACRQVGPIRFRETLSPKEEIFNVDTSIFLKSQHVVRFFDRKRNVLVYLTFSDKLLDGSPKNSISTVPVMPWR